MLVQHITGFDDELYRRIEEILESRTEKRDGQEHNPLIRADSGPSRSGGTTWLKTLVTELFGAAQPTMSIIKGTAKTRLDEAADFSQLPTLI